MYDELFMRRALGLAAESAALGEVPVGAVVVKDGKAIAEGKNTREADGLAHRHAELSAIDAACRALGTWRLTGCELYVTLEPCPMCAGAIVNAHIDRVYFGAKDEIYGCCGSRTDLLAMPGWFAPEHTGGYLEDECSALLKDFFRQLRSEKKERKRDGMTISMIAAVGRNNVIGGDNKLLWRLSSDLKFFKSVTMGKPVIMGRKTFESLPKALPGRKNIVITRSSDYAAEGASIAASPEEALSMADAGEVFIIGGQTIYSAFLGLADRLYITEVDVEKPEADAFFPEVDFSLYDRELIDEGRENGISYKHVLYTRKDKTDADT